MFALLLAASLLKPGDPAPPLSVQELLQAPEGAAATWPTLRGKAVVLEFWATWCAPCVEQIPHWNALVERFKGRPVQFIALSYEETEAVHALLAARPMAGWVAMDPAGETFRAYGVEAIPHTVLVDAKGVVRGVTTLQRLGEPEIEGLLAGRALELPQPPAGGG